MDIFTSTVAGVLQFRGGTQTVGKVGKVINYKGSPSVCVIDLRQDTCLFVKTQTLTPCPGFWYLTHADMFWTQRVEICFVSLHLDMQREETQSFQVQALMALTGASSSDEDKPFECLVCLQDVRLCEGE